MIDGMTRFLKTVTHALLIGVTMFLKAVTDAIEPAKVVAETHEFDRTLYDVQIWRKRGEPMQQFIIRRNADFTKLNDTVAGDCIIPAKFQAYLLLKLHGIDHTRAEI